MRRTRLVSVCFVLVAISVCQKPPVKKAQAKPVGQKIAGAEVPAWQQMESLLHKEWATRHPSETVVSVVRVGDPEYSEEPGKTETSTTTSGSFDWDSWGWNESTFSTTTKGREGSYLRQKVDVTAERANKTRATFSVAALFKLVNGKWTFAEMPVGKVQELAGAGAPAQPSDAEAARIFAAAWTHSRPDFTVGRVQVLGKEFNQSKGRYWLTYKLAVNVKGTDKASSAMKGKPFKCTPADYSSVLKWNKETSKWEADESIITNINESGQCDAE